MPSVNFRLLVVFFFPACNLLQNWSRLSGFQRFLHKLQLLYFLFNLSANSGILIGKMFCLFWSDDVEIWNEQFQSCVIVWNWFIMSEVTSWFCCMETKKDSANIFQESLKYIDKKLRLADSLNSFTLWCSDRRHNFHLHLDEDQYWWQVFSCFHMLFNSRGYGNVDCERCFELSYGCDI